MRVEFQNSIPWTAHRLAHRMETPRHTEMQDPLEDGFSFSGGIGGLRDFEETPEVGEGFLRTSMNRGPVGETAETVPVSRDGETTNDDRSPVATEPAVSGSRDVFSRPEAPVQTPKAPELIVTPFGIFERKPIVEGDPSNPPPVVDEWKTYFLTHAPGQWSSNEATRAKFAELYGEKALVTLDWAGTVPENLEPIWVTKVQVDDTGRPLPRTRNAQELT